MNVAGGAAAAVLAAALCAPGPAAAMPAPEGPERCLEPVAAGAVSASTDAVSRQAPTQHRFEAGTSASPETAAGAGWAGVAPASAITTVPTYVHVLRSPRGAVVTRARVLDQIKVLNSGFRGRQSANAAVAPYRFELAGVTRTVNRSWDHMTQGSTAERRAKRTLHRGNANDLNLYIVARTSSTLGWSTTPQTYDERPRMDGVVVARTTLPGGSRGRYSAGDVAVHETGHWFGLLHTFAGKCGRRGDRVADTPAEARASYTCPIGRDTCSGPGKDPIRNFMDYSYDSCMNHFTDGQVSRINRMWQRFRAGGS
jgi:hypothetical protein